MVCKVLSLIDQLSCPQIWKIELKDREKEKVGGRPAKLKEKQRTFFLLLKEQHENFVAAVTK